MVQLKVIVDKLNMRKEIPNALPEPKGIVGTVNKGFTFSGTDAGYSSNAGLGKWYKDTNGSFYWGGGLMVAGPVAVTVTPPPAVTVTPEATATNITVGPSVTLGGLPENLPKDFRLGVDLSHHNAAPDWDAFVQAGVSFAFIKISEGVGIPDKLAAIHAAKAKAHGIRVGYYHFCRPDTRGGTLSDDALAEANEAIYRMKNLAEPDLPLVLDLEDQLRWDTPLSPKNYTAWVKTYIERIRVAAGINCMIYSRTEYLNRKLMDKHGLENTKLWVSLYPKNPDCLRVNCPKEWKDWSIWQYTEKGSIGKSHVVDLNIMKDKDLF
jgi:lysozyme